MRTVAHILSYYPGREGLTSFCRGLGVAFQAVDGWSVPIITFRSKPSKNELEREPEVIKFPHRARHPFDIPASFLSALDGGDLKLDGAVLHGTYSPQAFAIARALYKRQLPYIFMPHDPYVKELRRHHAVRKFVYWHLCEKWVLNHAAAVQLLSDSHEAPLRELGVKVPVFTLANGCDPADLIHLDAEARVPGQGADFRIQFLGRMDRNHKGLDLLLRGYAKFLESVPEGANIQLVLSGNDWEDRGFLENLAGSLGIAKRVLFTGRLSEHSINIQSKADLCVLTSRFDGFGLTIVEAMLASRPVLVSTKAGIADHVAKSGGGFLVDPDPLSIANGLKEAWKQRADLGQIGERGHEYVTNQLTWASVAARSTKVYSKFFS